MSKNMKIMKRVVAWIIALLLLTGCASADNGTIVLPASLQSIDEEAFAGTNTQIVVIPEDTYEIGSKAFNPANGLTDVYLPIKKLTIADDAFDPSANIRFHYYLGSGNYQWLVDHGFDGYAQLITEEAPLPAKNAWKQVNDTISSESVSALNDNLFGTSRLILKTDGNVIPALDQFNPKKVIPLGNNLFVIQFNNHNDAGACCQALKSWTGCEYVEADYFLSSTEGAESDEVFSQQAMMANIDEDDPMGFQKYTEYLGDSIGNVRIAIIDSGVNADAVSCAVSDLSYDFITNQNKKNGFVSAHGTNVAKEMIACFGTLKNHLTILSYRVENPNNGAISYIQMGEALLQAREDGADFVNISIAGESAYSDAQDNEFLRECINLFGAGKVIAAAGNSAISANNFIPGKYCVSVTGVRLVDGQLIRASGTATNARYGGFATTTSMAAPKVTAAFALLSLDPDKTQKMSDALEPVETIQNGMPDMGRLAVRLVNDIVINDGYQTDSIYGINETDRIYYKVQPENASVSTVTISSTNPSVLQVLSNGGNSVRFRTINPGEAELVFASDDGNVEKRIAIQVIQTPTSVSITGNTGEVLKKGQTMVLGVTVLPANANDRTVTWTSSNNRIATVSDNGIVTQVGAGTVTITATANGNPFISDSITVEASNEVPVSGVTIAPAGGVNTLYLSNTAGTVQMNAAVQPESASQTVTWSSSNTGVATISSSGLVTAKGKGNTTITATAADGNAKGYYEITVIQLPTAVTVSGATSVVENAEIQLTATVSPSNANNTTVNWSSSNTNTATVTTSGKVKGINAGTVVITATAAANANAAKTYTITVQPATFTVTLNANGGNCDKASITGTRNVALGTLPTPTRSYYTFDGWYTSASGGTKVTSSTTYSEATNITIYAHWTLKPLSGWVEPSAVPSGAATIEQKTQYRYRDQYASYSDWSAWGSWVANQETISDANLKEEYHVYGQAWWAAQCTSCGTNNPYHGSSSSCKKCGHSLANSKGYWTSVWYYSADTSGTTTIYGRDKGKYFEGKGYWLENKRDLYRYRTRTVSYPWGSWSSWSDSSVTATSTRQVETRTLVRYREK